MKTRETFEVKLFLQVLVYGLVNLNTQKSIKLFDGNVLYKKICLDFFSV